MAVPVCLLWPTLLLLKVWGAAGDAEEVEIFGSDGLERLGWTSRPNRQWQELRMALGAGGRSVPVLQACGEGASRSVLSPSMEPGPGPAPTLLLMDLAFAQEAEPGGEPGPLQIQLQQPAGGGGVEVASLRASRPFPRGKLSQQQLASHLERRRAVRLGRLGPARFRLGLSFGGTCVLVTSIRIYYRRCGPTQAGLARFGSAAAGPEPLPGSCVAGAAPLLPPPARTCREDGSWGPPLGGCACKPGYQLLNNHSCQACQMGEYKAANQTACRPCPPNSATHREGSHSCPCLPGFARLPLDPTALGCTSPPSAPVDLTPHPLNHSVVLLKWAPPHQSGGRAELTYDVQCEAAAAVAAVGAGPGWEACGDHEALLPRSTGLTNTSVVITGLRPHTHYRLTVTARNDLSTRPGAPPPSTAIVTIHAWERPPEAVTGGAGLTTESAGLITEGAGLFTKGARPTLPHGVGSPAPHRHSSFSNWLRLLMAACVSALLLMAFISIAMCVRRIHHKIRSEPDLELLPTGRGVAYRRQLEAEAVPLQAPGQCMSGGSVTKC